MSPVIRISDSIFKRLESYAIGFDTPSNVIERLIDFFESENKTEIQDQLSKPMNTSKSNIVTNRKFRDIEKEKALKLAFGKSLQWGNFVLESNSVLNFNKNGKKVLCKYSSFSKEQGRWFWGVPLKHWSNWDDNFFLALIMENQDLNGYSYLLLNPKEAKHLFPMCSESNQEKKINLRIYKEDAKLHIQEWQEYDVENKISNLNYNNI